MPDMKQDWRSELTVKVLQGATLAKLASLLGQGLGFN